VLADDEEAPDPPLTPQQRRLVKALTSAQIRAIDLALLANISPNWRSVARVVAATMLDVENRAGGIPDVFYAERVRLLVERGIIEAQGDMSRMRLLEVRFATRSATANSLKSGSVIDLGNLDASHAVTKSADVEFIDVFSADASTGQESNVEASGADLSNAVSGTSVDAPGETETNAAGIVDIADRASGSDDPGTEPTATAATPVDSATTDSTSTAKTDDVHVTGVDLASTDLCSTPDSVETVKAD
jgi:hypothetical protein